MRVIDK